LGKPESDILPPTPQPWCDANILFHFFIELWRQYYACAAIACHCSIQKSYNSWRHFGTEISVRIV